MKINSNKIDDFIKNQIKHLKGALLYGPDEGVVFERKKLIIKQILGENFDPLQLCQFNYKNILDSFYLVSDEANALSLMADRKFIIIDNIQESIVKNLTNYFQLLKSDCFILIIANDLSPSSKLRKLFETDKDQIISLPCYVDDEASLRRIIQSELKEYKINYEIVNYFASLFHGNRKVLLNEIEKLKTFLGDKKDISSDDVEVIINSSKEQDFQSFANIIADLNLKQIKHEIKQNKKLGSNEITLCRILINYFTKLYKASCFVQLGMNIPQSVSSLKPPVFFKQKDQMIKHLNKWQHHKILDFLEKLQQYELKLKENSHLNFADILFTDFLVKYLTRI